MGKTCAVFRPELMLFFISSGMIKFQSFGFSTPRETWRVYFSILFLRKQCRNTWQILAFKPFEECAACC
jgi:hypothetical protein